MGKVKKPAKSVAKSLRLEWRSPQELAENPANWRRHPESQVAALADVIGEVGWAGACLYNERTKRLIDGHARRAVALQQGAKQVPVLVGSWTEEQERKILATLDPLAALAEADPEALAALLADIETESEAVAAMLDGLAHDNGLAAVEPGAGGDEFDATPAESGPTRTSPGELWVIGGKHRLLVGDCTDAGNVLILFNGKTPFMMVTDPPYGVDYDPTWRDGVGSFADKTKMRGQVQNDDVIDWTEAYRQFPGDVVYIWHAGKYCGKVASNIDAVGFEIRSQVVWKKQHFAMSRGDYHWHHEPCWYAVRRGCVSRWNGDRTQSTIWEIDSLNPAGRGKINAGDEKTNHGTQKPIECMARPIRNHGAEGDIVYDPFLGSGTTLIAAHRLGRICYGCEIECRYADVILKRAEAEGLDVKRAKGG